MSQMKGVHKYRQGYRFRVEYKGDTIEGYCGPQEYGDSARALDAANRAALDAHLELGKPLTTRLVFTQARSNTGILGVHECKKGGAIKVCTSPEVGHTDQLHLPRGTPWEYAGRVREDLQAEIFSWYPIEGFEHAETFLPKQRATVEREVFATTFKKKHAAHHG